MILNRKFFCSFLVLVSLLSLLPARGNAETIKQTFSHSLGMSESAKSWEHRIDLPDALSARNVFFVKRTLALSGRLVIEREELKATYYYVKVRLPKHQLFGMKGSLTVSLETGTQTPQTPVLDSCTKLLLRTDGTLLQYSWEGKGGFTALTLLDKGSGETVWERVILGKKAVIMDEGWLYDGHHYLWAVKQSDETGRYSAEARSGFRIVLRYQTCQICHGMGNVFCMVCHGSGTITTTGPNGQPIPQTCYNCHGTGKERCSKCNGTGQVKVHVIYPE